MLFSSKRFVLGLKLISICCIVFLSYSVIHSQSGNELRAMFNTLKPLSDGDKTQLEQLQKQVQPYFAGKKQLSLQDSALLYIIEGGIKVMRFEADSALPALIIADSLSAIAFDKFSEENRYAKIYLGSAYGYTGNLAKEREIYEELLVNLNHDAHPDLNKIASVYHSLAMNYGAADGGQIGGDRVTEQNYLRKGINIMDNYHPAYKTDLENKQINLVNLYNSLSLSCYATNNYSDALFFAHKSLSLRNGLPLSAERAINYMVIGRSIYKTDYNLDSSLSYVDSSLQILEESGFKNEVPWLTYMGYKADILIDAGKLKEAITITKNVIDQLSDAKKINTLVAGPFVLSTAELSKALILLGRTEEAVAVCRPIATLIKEKKFYASFSDMSLFSQYAYALSSNKQWDDAEIEFKEVIAASGYGADSLRLLGEKELPVRVYPFLKIFGQYGDMLVKKGFAENNKQDMQLGISILTKTIKGWKKNKEFFAQAGIDENTNKFEVGMHEALLNALYKAKDILGAEKCNELAFAAIENSKGDLLKANIFREKQLLSLLPDSSASQLRTLKYNIYKATGVMYSAATGTTEHNLITAKFAYTKYSDSLKKAYKVQLDDVNANSVIAASDELLTHFKGTIIHYFLGDSNLYAHVMSNGRQSFIKKPVLKTFEKDLYDQRSKCLVKGASVGDSSWHRLIKTQKEWYEWLLGGINLEKDIVIIPYGQLSFISFEMLDESKDTMPHYLVETHTIRYEMSASLIKQATKEDDNRDLTFFGGFAASRFKKEELYAPDANNYAIDPTRSSMENLPETETEVQQAADTLHGESHHHTTPKVFLDNVSNYRIILVATHASADKGPYHECSLMFEKDSFKKGMLVNDSVVRDVDIMGLKKLNSDLIVLSACNTGTGRLNNSEGSRSLGRAFFMSGCKAVVMSLWEVSSASTKEIMTYFFVNIRHGQNKAEALRNAKLSYMAQASPERRHPYYWAGFVLMGDDTPVKPLENRHKTMWLIVGLIAVLTTGVVVYKIRATN